MIPTSVQRLFGVTSSFVNKIVLVKNIGTLSLCPRNIDAQLFEVRSVFTCIVVPKNPTKYYFTTKAAYANRIEDTIPALQMKKRPLRKKRLITEDDEVPQPGFWKVKALATAEDYNLEGLMEGLVKQDLYIPRKINTSSKYMESITTQKKEKLMMTPCIDLPLNDQDSKDLIENAKDWALAHGMLMRSKTNFSKDGAQLAPFTLLPSSFPRKEFENACEIQLILNTLMHAVAHDYNFLKENLVETVRVDSFMAKLFDIYETMHKEGFSQKISLGLLRSDLMLESGCARDGSGEIPRPFCCWKQVEINTIASGFGWLGPSATNLHKYVLGELGLDEKLHNIPENNALQGLCGGMIEAWKIYDDPKSVILFVIEDVTYNICDQRFHEFEIRRQNSDVRVIRRTLTQLAKEAKLSNRKELLVNGKPVAVVYFRCGYEPAQYPTSKEWDARLLIERSLAIKCPSIQYHLAGSKKIQEALAKPGVVARYLKNEESAARVKEIFTSLYSLELNEHGDAAMKMAITEPERYVLKPQREGGGNNVYGKDIKILLESMKSQSDRAAYILMGRIHPPVQMNYFIRAGSDTNHELKELCTELGIFGVVIGDSERIILNKQTGHMLRAKLSSSNEGGVMSGAGGCDSPYLID